MDSQIIAEVAIVDCRAFVAVVFSTSPGTKVADGFSYNLNGQVSAAAAYFRASRRRLQTVLAGCTYDQIFHESTQAGHRTRLSRLRGSRLLFSEVKCSTCC